MKLLRETQGNEQGRRTSLKILKSRISMGRTPKPRDANQNCPFPQLLIPKMSKPSPIPKQGRETKKTSILRHPIPRKPPALVKLRTRHQRLCFILLYTFSRSLHGEPVSPLLLDYSKDNMRDAKGKRENGKWNYMILSGNRLRRSKKAHLFKL
jgi:hypothetical protein